MNPEINPALAVLFRRLRETGEMSRYVWPQIVVVISCDSIELVRDDRKRDVISSVESAKNLEDGATKSGMARRISRKRRSEIWALQIAGRRAEGMKGWVADS